MNEKWKRSSEDASVLLCCATTGVVGGGDDDGDHQPPQGYHYGFSHTSRRWVSCFDKDQWEITCASSESRPVCVCLLVLLVGFKVKIVNVSLILCSLDDRPTDRTSDRWFVRWTRSHIHDGSGCVVRDLRGPPEYLTVLWCHALLLLRYVHMGVDYSVWLLVTYARTRTRIFECNTILGKME